MPRNSREEEVVVVVDVVVYDMTVGRVPEEGGTTNPDAIRQQNKSSSGIVGHMESNRTRDECALDGINVCLAASAGENMLIDLMDDGWFSTIEMDRETKRNFFPGTTCFVISAKVRG